MARESPFQATEVSAQESADASEPRVDRGVIAVVATATALAPLNSTMIAVALVQIQNAFGIGIVSTTWLISTFYIASVVAQPLMGRVVDQFGPRRTYCAGLLLVGLTGALTPFASSFWMLVVSRLVLALGTSAAYPAGMALLRRESGSGDRFPLGALAATSVVGASAASLGPVIGGLLVDSTGWWAIFLINVPLSLVSILLAFRWISPDPPLAVQRRRDVIALLDPLGVMTFTVGLAALLGFLLSIPTGTLWWLLLISPVALTMFVMQERRTTAPFLDIEMLRRNPAFVAILVQFLFVNLVFYSLFFGLPVWLESVQSRPSAEVGAIIFPITLVSIALTPVATRAIRRHGTRPVLLVGLVAVLLTCSSALTLRAGSPTWLVVSVAALAGLPNSLTNMSLQARVFEVIPSAQTGIASGLFMSSRFVGAILASTLIGLLVGHRMDENDLRLIVMVCLVFAVALLASALRRGPADEVSAVQPG